MSFFLAATNGGAGSGCLPLGALTFRNITELYTQSCEHEAALGNWILLRLKLIQR